MVSDLPLTQIAVGNALIVLRTPRPGSVIYYGCLRRLDERQIICLFLQVVLYGRLPCGLHRCFYFYFDREQMSPWPTKQYSRSRTRFVSLTFRAIVTNNTLIYVVHKTSEVNIIQNHLHTAPCCKTAVFTTCTLPYDHLLPRLEWCAG